MSLQEGSKQGTHPSQQRGTNTRMRDRLQASIAGLEELRMLRDRQQYLVDDAKEMMDRSKTRRHSLDAENSFLEYMRPEEHSFRQKRNSLSVVHEHDADVTQNIVADWLQTTTAMHAQIKKPDFQIGPSSNSDSSPSKDNSASQDLPRNCDTNSKTELCVENTTDSIESRETETSHSGFSNTQSGDFVDGIDAPKTSDKSGTVGAKTADLAFQQSVAELSGYSRCSPHRRFSLDASLLAEMQRKPFMLPFGTSSQGKQTGAKVNTKTEGVIKPNEINKTAGEIGTQSKQITEVDIPKSAFVDKPDSCDVTPTRIGRRQSFDFTSARAGAPPMKNLQRRASFSVGMAPGPRTSYQKSYTLSGCKTKFNFPSPLHAVLMNRQKVVLSEENDCAASSSGSDSLDTLNRSSETLYDTDSQVHDHLYAILSQDDSHAKQSSKNSRNEGTAASRLKAQSRGVARSESQRLNAPRELPVATPDPMRTTVDSGSMENIRAICNNTRRASVGEVIRRKSVPAPNPATDTDAPPPLKPRLRKSGNQPFERGAPSSFDNKNQNTADRNMDMHWQLLGQINNVPRSRKSVDSVVTSYGKDGNIPRSRGSIESVVSAVSTVESLRSDAEPTASSTPRSGTPNLRPRSQNPKNESNRLSGPVMTDSVPQVRMTKTQRDSNNNGAGEDNLEIRASHESLRFSRCDSPDSFFDRPPPIPEKRFSLRSEAADSGFMSSCMSLQTTSSGYSYKPRNSYDPKLSIASIEEGYISSQSTGSPKQKHHSHKLSIRSDCSFMSTGSSYFAEDELSEDEQSHHVEDSMRTSPPEPFARVNPNKSLGAEPRNIEVNRISSASDAKRVDIKRDIDNRQPLRKGILGSNTLSDFRQILHENKKNQNKSTSAPVHSPDRDRRYSLPTNALSPQCALRQKYLCYNNTDMAPIQDTSI